MTDAIIKRAKERALYLLERKMYTHSMMRRKLLDSDYPESVVEQVLLFLEEYHYIDDRIYAGMYIRDNSEKKSKRQIMLDLQKKGIDKDLIVNYFEENDYSELKCFENQFKKYVRGKDLNDFLVKQKVFRYFYGKGFSFDLICDYIQHIAEV